MTAGFKDIIETYKITLDISIRIGDTITNPSLGCKIYDNGNWGFKENSLTTSLSAIEARTKVQSRFNDSISLRRSYLILTS